MTQRYLTVVAVVSVREDEFDAMRGEDQELLVFAQALETSELSCMVDFISVQPGVTRAAKEAGAEQDDDGKLKEQKI